MDKIKLKINNQIGKITFHHPKANCLSGETINNLITLLEKASPLLMSIFTHAI